VNEIRPRTEQIFFLYSFCGWFVEIFFAMVVTMAYALLQKEVEESN